MLKIFAHKKLKGIEEIELTIGTIMIIFTVSIGILFLDTHVIKMSADLKNTKEELNAVDIAHLVKDCFTTSPQLFATSSAISSDFLNENKGKEIQKICSLPAETYVMVKNLESGEEWLWGAKKKYSHSLFAPIRSGDKIDVGVIDVKI